MGQITLRWGAPEGDMFAPEVAPGLVGQPVTMEKDGPRVGTIVGALPDDAGGILVTIDMDRAAFGLPPRSGEFSAAPVASPRVVSGLSDFPHVDIAKHVHGVQYPGPPRTRAQRLGADGGPPRGDHTDVYGTPRAERTLFGDLADPGRAALTDEALAAEIRRGAAERAWASAHDHPREAWCSTTCPSWSPEVERRQQAAADARDRFIRRGDNPAPLVVLPPNPGVTDRGRKPGPSVTMLDDNGRWVPAEPIPMRGWKARTEEWARGRGWDRLAGMLGRWDERGLGS